MYNTLGNNPLNDASFELEDYSWYWTSSEHDINNSWNVNFINGDDDHDKQYEFDNVRPVRAFGYTLGCMDPLASNFNPLANMSDGSCIPVIEGCLDETAFNYSPEANTDDGSCTPVIEGCLNETAFNYSIEANTDDGSCYPIIEGCLNPIAANYVNPNGDVQIDVNTDDGSCLYSSDVYDNILEDLSVFETVEEEQDYSMSFDGIDDYVLVNSSESLKITSDLSISLQITSEEQLSNWPEILAYMNLEEEEDNNILYGL